MCGGVGQRAVPRRLLHINAERAIVYLAVASVPLAHVSSRTLFASTRTRTRLQNRAGSHAGPRTTQISSEHPRMRGVHGRACVTLEFEPMGFVGHETQEGREP